MSNQVLEARQMAGSNSGCRSVGGTRWRARRATLVGWAAYGAIARCHVCTLSVLNCGRIRNFRGPTLQRACNDVAAGAEHGVRAQNSSIGLNGITLTAERADIFRTCHFLPRQRAGADRLSAARRFVCLIVCLYEEKLTPLFSRLQNFQGPLSLLEQVGGLARHSPGCRSAVDGGVRVWARRSALGGSQSPMTSW